MPVAICLVHSTNFSGDTSFPSLRVVKSVP